MLPSLALCDLIHCKHEQDQLFYSFRLGDAAPEDQPMHATAKSAAMATLATSAEPPFPAEGLSADSMADARSVLWFWLGLGAL